MVMTEFLATVVMNGWTQTVLSLTLSALHGNFLAAEILSLSLTKRLHVRLGIVCVSFMSVRVSLFSGHRCVFGK